MLIGGALTADPTDYIKLTGVVVFIFGILILAMGIIGAARG